MRLTNCGHSCVRLADGDRRLVIDPGVWARDDALDDVVDVLITHEHADHVAPHRLAGKGLNIHAPASVVAFLAREGIAANAVEAGTAFTAAGFSVRAVGGWHAEVYGGVPHMANIGYVIDENVYHPGDSFFVPDVGVRTLLLPVSAPWLKLGESIAFAHAIAPTLAVPIHDAILDGAGMDMIDNLLAASGPLGGLGGASYQRIGSGDSVEI